MGAQFAGQGDEEGASESAGGDRGDDCRGFLTISVNILSVVEYVEGEEEAVEYVEGEEEASWLHPTRAGGGYEKSHSGGLRRGSPAVIRVLREVMQIHGGHMQNN